MAISVVATVATSADASATTLDSSSTLDLQVGDIVLAFVGANGVTEPTVAASDSSFALDMGPFHTNWWSVSQRLGRVRITSAATGVTIRASFGDSMPYRSMVVVQLRPDSDDDLFFYDGFRSDGDYFNGTALETAGYDIVGDDLYGVAASFAGSVRTHSAMQIGGTTAAGDVAAGRGHAWWGPLTGSITGATAAATIDTAEDVLTDWMIVKAVPRGQAVSSVRVSTTVGADFFSQSLPSSGFLFTGYCRPIAETGDYPHNRGNLNIMEGVSSDTVTRLIGLTANIEVDAANVGASRYNANTTLAVTGQDEGVGDFNLVVENDRHVSEVDAYGWHFYAVLFDIDASHNVTLHQWSAPGKGARIRYAAAHYPDDPEDPVILATDSPYPSDLVTLYLGRQPSENSSTYYYDIAQCRIYARGSDDVPTIAEIEAIMLNGNADTSAWADWSLVFEDGAAVVADRSGNSRDLVPNTGAVFYQGATFYDGSTAAAVTWDVSYDANGGTGSQTDANSPYEDGATVTVLGTGTIARSGYSFVGWNTAADGSGTAYDPDDTFEISEDTTLYAQWALTPTTYTVTYDANEGTTPPTDSTEYETEETATILGEASMTRSGYTFIEWNTSADGTGTSYIEHDLVSITGNLTLYAIWALTDTRPRYLGINLFAGQVDWVADRLFADVMKSARDWVTAGTYGGGAAVEVDSNGWPTGDAEIVLWAGIGSMHGTYHLRGEAAADPTIGLGFGGGTVSNHTYTDGVFEADLVVSDTGSTGLLLTLTNTAGGVQNVSVMRPTVPGSTTSYTLGTNFTTEALALVEDFDVVRFMFLIDGWNGAWQVDWEDRVQPDTCSFSRNAGNVINGVTIGWAGTGAAWEVAIDFANETGKDVWINMPLGASDDYIRNLAQLWKDNYTVENGKIYWEYSNEATWDLLGVTSAWLRTQGAADDACTYDGVTDVNVLGRRYYGKRAAEMSLIWREVWGAEMLDTVRPCLCGQMTADSELSTATHFIRNWFGNEDGNHVDMSHPLDYLFWGSGSSYYSGDNPSELTDDVSEIDNFERWAEEESSLAMAHGLKRTYYEGGVWTDAEHYTDDLIRTAMVRYHKLFEKYGGEVPMFYVTTGGEDNGTALGFTMSALDKDTQKYAALGDLIAVNRVAPYGGTLAPCTIPGADFSFSSDESHPAAGAAITTGNAQFDQWRLWRTYLFRTSENGDVTVTLNWTGTFSSIIVVDLDGEEIYHGAGTSIALALPAKYCNAGMHSVRVGVVGTTSEYLFLSSVGVAYTAANQHYSLTIDPNGAIAGSHWAKQWAEAAASATLPTNTVGLALTNYDLSGFNTTADGSGTHYDLGATYTMPAADTVLFAEWTASAPPEYYSVTYDANGGSGTVTDSNSPYADGTTVTVLANTGFSLTGYAFVGWNTAADGTGTAYVPTDTFSMPAENIVLYAQWTLLPLYTITFDGNGATAGDPPGSIAVVQGQATTLPTNTGGLTLEGYTLAGWSDGVSLFGLGTSYTPTEDITLYAYWVELGIYRVYKRSYDSEYAREYGRGPNLGMIVEV